ncbi:MAG: SpoIID/LytB domain-containing protein [Bacteroidetes bacterium]|nr:MAG: SpoIID/LytB domain-containing protein [Bacteroidota bacterium]
MVVTPRRPWWPATALCALLLALALPARADDDLLRIRLFDRENPKALTISSEDGLLLYAGDATEPMQHLGRNASVRISVRGTELFVEVDDLRLHATSLRVRPDGANPMTLTATTAGDETVTRRYPGTLTLTPGPDGSLVVVNHVDVETYVAAVVAREYGFDDLEGAKAMAVLIRTYALRALGKFGADYDHVDHTLSQVYQGLDRISEVAREAARQTAGEILTYRGEPVEAVYFASSGGHTADNETVWEAAPRPYLRGKRDPYDRSPHASWQFRANRSELLAALSDAFGQRVEGFLIEERSRDGRVRTITLLGSPERTVTGNAFRLAVLKRFGPTSLKSTLFDARVQGNQYVFDGRGFGHGVGLSQWGAHEMARQGHDYRDILAFYYTDVQIQRNADYAALLARRDTPPALADAMPRPETPVSADLTAGSSRAEPDDAAPLPPPRPQRAEPERAILSWTGPARTSFRRSQPRRLGW